jgi:hypothetical protein
MSEATKADRPLPVLSSEWLGRMIGADLAEVIDPGTLAACMDEAFNSDMGVTAKELAVARALLFAVSGSALMNGEKKSLKDAGTLYRMVCAANSLLIGRPGGPAA